MERIRVRDRFRGGAGDTCALGRKYNSIVYTFIHKFVAILVCNLVQEMVAAVVHDDRWIG